MNNKPQTAAKEIGKLTWQRGELVAVEPQFPEAGELGDLGVCAWLWSGVVEPQPFHDDGLSGYWAGLLNLAGGSWSGGGVGGDVCLGALDRCLLACRRCRVPVGRRCVPVFCGGLPVQCRGVAVGGG